MLLFFHLSIFIISQDKFKEKKNNQNIFDEIFINLENHIRELGYGDVAVNKKMKLLTKIFYDILVKLNEKNDGKFLINQKIVSKYFLVQNDKVSNNLKELSEYFSDFHNYCFAIKRENMINDLKKYKYTYGSS